MTLDKLPIGQSARIVSVDWNALVEEEARRLRALGLEEGARVSVAHRGVFVGRDPIAITIGRMTVAVRRAHAAAMHVDVIENGGVKGDSAGKGAETSGNPGIAA